MLAPLSLGSVLHDPNLINGLYIVAFSLFIYGLSGLTGPKTAVRGNRIAAVGMVLAVIATLLISADGEAFGIRGIDWALIAGALALGAPLGWASAKKVKMTAMPQMVALFNGVGGGTVAIIAWVEFRNEAYTAIEFAIPALFAAIVGSVSFWGSNVAFAKLQELIDGKPRGLPGQQYINAVLLAVAVGLSALIAVQATGDGTYPSELLIILLLVVTGILGLALVFPIGGADMPVVISLLNAFTGLSAAAMGVALDNTALIVAGMIVGASAPSSPTRWPSR